MIRPIVETDYPQLAAIWESAVIATHDFLRPEDFMYYKARLPEYFRYVSLFGYEEEEGRIVGCEAEGKLVGFIGLSEDSVEMLFVDNDSRGKGIGKSLIQFALNEYGISKVDVNEQNTQAVGFYERMGFLVSSRSDTDSEGKPYPILHMSKLP